MDSEKAPGYLFVGTWYKYINMYPPWNTVGCTSRGVRSYGETGKHTFFKNPEVYPPWNTVVYLTWGAVFDFGGKKTAKEKCLSSLPMLLPEAQEALWIHSPRFSPYGRDD